MATRRKILVIDDEAEICEMTKLLLERAGHEVACANNGRVAIRLLAEQPFDLVITDMLMPERDGLEVMADLRRHHPAVRIIASSGGGRVSSDSYLYIARKSGAHALLPKPFTHKELLASIDAAFEPPPVAQPAA
jgi:CheY-like chemotaxis protein